MSSTLIAVIVGAMIAEVAYIVGYWSAMRYQDRPREKRKRE